MNLLTFSEPAKSTSDNLPLFTLPSLRFFWFIVITKIECDRELSAFMSTIKMTLVMLNHTNNINEKYEVRTYLYMPQYESYRHVSLLHTLLVWN